MSPLRGSGTIAGRSPWAHAPGYTRSPLARLGTAAKSARISDHDPKRLLARVANGPPPAPRSTLARTPVPPDSGPTDSATPPWFNCCTDCIAGPFRAGFRCIPTNDASRVASRAAANRIAGGIVRSIGCLWVAVANHSSAASRALLYAPALSRTEVFLHQPCFGSSFDCGGGIAGA